LEGRAKGRLEAVWRYIFVRHPAKIEYALDMHDAEPNFRK